MLHNQLLDICILEQNITIPTHVAPLLCNPTEKKRN